MIILIYYEAKRSNGSFENIKKYAKKVKERRKNKMDYAS